MTNRDGRHRTNLELPIEVKNAMKEEDEPMWKVATKAIRMYKGLDEASTEHALTRRIEQVENEIEALDDEITQKESERDAKQELLEDLVHKREEIREKKQSHRERLDDILDEMLTQSEKMVLAWMSELKEAATEEYGSPSTENIERVVGDLRTRRDERNLAIPDHRFQRSPGPATATSAQTDGGNELSAWEESLLNADADDLTEADD